MSVDNVDVSMLKEDDGVYVRTNEEYDLLMCALETDGYLWEKGDLSTKFRAPVPCSIVISNFKSFFYTDAKTDAIWCPAINHFYTMDDLYIEDDAPDTESHNVEDLLRLFCMAK